MPVLADAIDFSASGTQTGTGWFFSGFTNGTLRGQGNDVTMERIGTTNIGPVALASSFSLTWTTAPGITGNGTPSDPFLCSAGGNIKISSGSTIIFNGTFTSAQAVFTSAKGFTFVANGVAGWMNSFILAMLQFPSGTGSNAVDRFTGELTVPANFTGNPEGSFTSAVLALTAVPEPANLTLVEAIMIGMAGILRRQKKK